MQEATEVAPTDKEVALAKSEMLNSFVFNFASSNTQMQRVAAYALLGIPEVTLVCDASKSSFNLVSPLMISERSHHQVSYLKHC